MITELLLNPITLIALTLAVFFSVMAFMRSRESRLKEREGAAAKPYRVADPYSAPQPPPATSFATPTLAPTPPSGDPDNPHKFFRQFGPTPDGSGSPVGPVGYVWE
jgi:hypothetical protein